MPTQGLTPNMRSMSHMAIIEKKSSEAGMSMIFEMRPTLCLTSWAG